MAQTRLAVDIGGTFTDLVLEHAGARHTAKRLTTHEDPAAAVLAGVDDLMARVGLRPESLGLIVHGTTLATNALIERRGAKTALLTTEGHRDAVEIAYENRFDQYDINIDRPEPLVPRYLRLGVRERMSVNGDVLRPLDAASVATAIETLAEEAVESVAIGLLHGYANPAHEVAIAEQLQQALPTVVVTLASAVCPEIREYERISTACANAYIKPLMARYLQRLAEQLRQRGLVCPFLLMTSGGGLTDLATAVAAPIRLVESGPAGGAILAQRVAADLGFRRVLSFDMGGTTAKLCLVDDGEPLKSSRFEVGRTYRYKKGSGLPLRIPVIEMVEIGAGGGSVARVDALKRVQVGPDSAGSEPGPAAYDRGGERPTVTDADLVLGKLIPKGFAEGRLTLDPEAAERAVAREVASPLSLSPAEAAFAINEVVDESMAAAARAHALEWGKSLSDRVMIAFGGAAPAHAARLAEKLGIQEVVIPRYAGVGSAVGFLLAPIAFEIVRSRPTPLAAFDETAIASLLQEMETEAADVVREGAPNAALSVRRQAFMRYAGQGHEIAVELPDVKFSADRLWAEFERAYSNLYGRTIEGSAAEVLSWSVLVSAEVATLAFGGEPDRQASTRAFDPSPWFDGESSRSVAIPSRARPTLAAGAGDKGPCRIVESQTTTFVPANYRLSVTPEGHLRLRRRTR